MEKLFNIFVLYVPDLDGKFKYHYYKKDYILHKKIIKLIENLLVTIRV